jgi:integrase
VTTGESFKRNEKTFSAVSFGLRARRLNCRSFRGTASVTRTRRCLAKWAQALLGHSDMETTLNVYTHAIPESQKRVVDKVAEILFPNVPKFVGAVENSNVN